MEVEETFSLINIVQCISLHTMQEHPASAKGFCSFGSRPLHGLYVGWEWKRHIDIALV